MLKEGDLRTTGKVPEVVEIVFANPDLFQIVIEGMVHPDAGVRMRSADAAEKITRKKPDYLIPYKKLLLEGISQLSQQEVRWHLAQIIPRLELNARERKQAAASLLLFLEDSSKIVQVNALSALVELAKVDDQLLAVVKDIVEDKADNGSPAVRKRAGKLRLELVRKIS